MRKNILTKLAVAFAACLSITAARGAAFDHEDDFKERDASRQTYALAPGAIVEINSVSGGVTVETSESSRAEVEIVRTARTRADLDCRQFKVETSSDRLRLDGNDDRRQCRNVQVHQTLNLRLPRRVNLDVNSVSGHVRVGALDGSARLNSVSGNASVERASGKIVFSSISGSATVARASGDVVFSSISGRVRFDLTSLGGGGVRVNSVSGTVDVGLPDGANADISVRSISGSVTSNVPGLTINKIENSSDFEGRVGGGGTKLTFNSISGNVRFHRTGE
ncbi:MAG: DUF4097 domain-containing protein [Pyrinomonadaceae bacterium]